MDWEGLVGHWGRRQRFGGALGVDWERRWRCGSGVRRTGSGLGMEWLWTEELGGTLVTLGGTVRTLGETGMDWENPVSPLG